MITGEQINQLLQLNLLFMSELANSERISTNAKSLSELKVAEISFNFLLDSAVNMILDEFHDHDLTPIGGFDGNERLRIERDKLAVLVYEKLKQVPNGEEVYRNYCDTLKNFR